MMLPLLLIVSGLGFLFPITANSHTIWAIAPAIAALAPIVSGFLGNIFGAGDRAKAQQAAEEAFKLIDSVGAAPDLARDIMLTKFKEVGVLTPELENDIHTATSEVANIQEDPKLRNAQMDALQLLAGKAESGLNASDRVRINDVRNKMNAEGQAAQNSIIQGLQERGIAGGGAEIAARLSGAQNTANSLSAQGDDIAAQANEAALQSIAQAGTLGGQIRSQDFQVADTKAAAADEFNRFNVQNAIARQQRNVDRNNQAAETNLNAKQNIANANTSMQNAEAQRQRQAEAEVYNMNMNHATQAANAKMSQAQFYGGQADKQGSIFSGIGAGVGAGIAADTQATNANNQLALQKQQLALQQKQLTNNSDYLDWLKTRNGGN